MPRFESGNISAPTIAFDASQSTGLSYADGIALSHNGAQVLHVGNTVTVDAVLVGNGAGLSGIHASNITGLTAALDTIDASSVTANTFAGDGSGLSNIAAANVTGLTAALDVIDASSVSSNVFIGDGSGLSNISTANLAGNLTVDDLTVTTLSSHLLPSANVTYDLGNPTQRFRDLFLAGNTIDLAGALIQALGANVFIQNLDVGTITGNGRGLSGVVIPPSINIITITDSNWNPIDDLALSTSSTGYLTIQGNNFEATGTTVSVGGTAASSISFVNSNTLRVSVNPKSTGTYDVVVETGGGSTTKINAVSFDPIPVWSTSNSLGNVVYANAFSITLAASEGGGSAITYSNTTALPPSTTLASNGVLQGNIVETSSSTYNFTVEAIDAQLQSALRSFSLVYTFFLASGGTVTTSGSYQIHTFTASGTFNVSGSPKTIQYLVVAGGGGGGSGDWSGGGGAGGLRTGSQSISSGTYSIVVGSGGAVNTNGQNSSFNGITSIAGGRGGSYNNLAAGSGGSGGGGAYSGGVGGAGTAGQGNAGGTASNVGGYGWGGGGGGAGAAGTTAVAGTTVGNGGNGLAISIAGAAAVYFAGGGGGGVDYTGYTVSGGLGGGGNGSVNTGGQTNTAGTNGSPNTGGGGGTKANGGSGIVVIWYLS